MSFLKENVQSYKINCEKLYVPSFVICLLPLYVEEIFTLKNNTVIDNVWVASARPYLIFVMGLYRSFTYIHFLWKLSLDSSIPTGIAFCIFQQHLKLFWIIPCKKESFSPSHNIVAIQ